MFGAPRTPHALSVAAYLYEADGHYTRSTSERITVETPRPHPGPKTEHDVAFNSSRIASSPSIFGYPAYAEK